MASRRHASGIDRQAAILWYREVAGRYRRIESRECRRLADARPPDLQRSKTTWRAWREASSTGGQNKLAEIRRPRGNAASHRGQMPAIRSGPGDNVSRYQAPPSIAEMARVARAREINSAPFIASNRLACRAGVTGIGSRSVPRRGAGGQRRRRQQSPASPAIKLAVTR